MPTIEDVRIIELPKFLDARGNLSFAEQNNHIPFEIKRTYWIYDVPGGEERGGHAFKENQEFIVALSGAFDVVVDDGQNKKTFTLNRSYYGLYIPKGLWRTMENFSTNSLALEFGSMHYDETDYIYDYEEYHRYREGLMIQGSGFMDKDSNREPLIVNYEPAKYNVFDCTMVELDRHHSDRKGKRCRLM